LLRKIKLTVLRAARSSRVSSLLYASRWRRSRLLILCYHGIALDDEYRWRPSLYITPGQFRDRLECLRGENCAVLPLGEAVGRLDAGTLPARSVALTFDDGFHDFYEAAWPILKEFSLPATVFQTTYYSECGRPVFNLVCDYLLWKSSLPRLEWPEVIGNAAVALDPEGRRSAVSAIQAHCARENLSGGQEGRLVQELADRLGVNLAPILSRRLLHLMNREELREIAAAGIDIQLHTHRHRVPVERDRLWAEIDENRACIERLTGRKAEHFCYPSGLTRPGLPDWLRQRGVISATTCRTGLASRHSDPLLLPRLLDTCALTEDEFLGWVTGIACLLPQRPFTPPEERRERVPSDEVVIERSFGLFPTRR
jgi:peptidoglycan/xylan/chitin deacetylase (PgdA/CDA1 family)